METGNSIFEKEKEKHVTTNLKEKKSCWSRHLLLTCHCIQVAFHQHCQFCGQLKLQTIFGPASNRFRKWPRCSLGRKLTFETAVEPTQDKSFRGKLACLTATQWVVGHPLQNKVEEWDFFDHKQCYVRLAELVFKKCLLKTLTFGNCSNTDFHHASNGNSVSLISHWSFSEYLGGATPYYFLKPSNDLNKQENHPPNRWLVCFNHPNPKQFRRSLGNQTYYVVFGLQIWTTLVLVSPVVQ